jgi:hypothetical protein
MKIGIVLLTAALVVPTALRGQNQRNEDASELRTKADAIRASADNLMKVRTMPWVTDVFEGFRLARAERRPVFLYMITGDPLGDC